METKFSIIVPVYNGESVIERCIKSVIEQSLEEWELLIINDGSIDGTKAICQKYLYDSRVQIINQVNKGVSDTRNTGIDKANGEYIVFVDADDWLHKDACTLFKNIMDYYECDFCIAGYNRAFLSGRTEVANVRSPLREGKYSLADFENGFKELYRSNFFNSPWAKCYRRNLITKYFDSGLSLGEDLLFNLNYLSKCKTIFWVNAPIYYYEIQESGSLSSGLKKNGFEILSRVYEESLEILDKIFNGHSEVKKVIDRKYAADFINMLERNVRYNIEHFGVNDLKNVYEKYSMHCVLKNVNLKELGVKWEIERRLLCGQHFTTFQRFTLLLLKIKKLREIKDKEL